MNSKNNVVRYQDQARLHFEQIPPEVGAGDEGGAEDGRVWSNAHTDEQKLNEYNLSYDRPE